MMLKRNKEVPLPTKDKVLFCSFYFYNSVCDWNSFTHSGVIGKEAFAPKTLTADDVFITMLLTIYLQCQYEAQNGHRPSRLRSIRSIKEDVSFTFNVVWWVMYSFTLCNDSNYERLWAASLKGFAHVLRHWRHIMNVYPTWYPTVLTDKIVSVKSRTQILKSTKEGRSNTKCVLVRFLIRFVFLEL